MKKIMYKGLFFGILFCPFSDALSSQYSVQVQCTVDGRSMKCGRNPDVVICGGKTFYADLDRGYKVGAVTTTKGVVIASSDAYWKSYRGEDVLIDMTQVSVSGDPLCSTSESLTNQPCSGSLDLVKVDKQKVDCGRANGKNFKEYAGPPAVCAGFANCHDNEGGWRQVVACAPSSESSCPPLYQCLLNKGLTYNKEPSDEMVKKGYSRGSGVLVTNLNGASREGICISADGRVEIGPDGKCMDAATMNADTCITKSRDAFTEKTYDVQGNKASNVNSQSAQYPGTSEGN